MFRNSKTPTFFTVFLCIIIVVISYKYWQLSDQYSYANSNRILTEEKVSNLIEKKAYLEKQTDIASERLKLLEDKVFDYENLLSKKDQELTNVKSSLEAGKTELVKQMLRAVI